MFNLTKQERQVLLFLLTATLVGQGIIFSLKVNSRLERLVKAANTITKININQATLEDLTGTKIISPKLAAKIIEYRANYGPFRALEDLKEVKGIGDYRYQKLKEFFYAG